MKPFPFVLLALLLGCFGLTAAQGRAKPKEANVNLDRFRLIPVLEGARVAPMDSYARTLILTLRGRPLRGEEPVSWLARVFFDPASTTNDHLLVLNHPAIAEEIQLTAEADHRRYRYADLEASNAVERLRELALQAEEVRQDFRTEREHEAVRFFRAVMQYRSHVEALAFTRPPLNRNLDGRFTVGNDELREELGIAEGQTVTFAELRGNEALSNIARGLYVPGRTEELTKVEREALDLIGDLRRFDDREQMHQFAFPPDVLPIDPHGGGTWRSPANALVQARAQRPSDPSLYGAVTNWVAMAAAYQATNQVAFDAAVERHLAFVTSRLELKPGALAERGASETMLARKNGTAWWNRLALLFGIAGILAFAFGGRTGRWIGGGMLLLLVGGTMLVVFARLYAGTVPGWRGITGIVVGLVGGAAGAVALLASSRPFWRLIGRILAGLTVYAIVVIGVVAMAGHGWQMPFGQEAGPGKWTLPVSWLSPIESAHNQANWFGRSSLLYLFAFIVAFAAVLMRKPLPIKIASVVAAIGLLFHFAGLEYRMFITARPPVYNLYATFVFVGAVCVLLGIVAEGFKRTGIAIMCASFTGWALVLMSNLSMFSAADTMAVVMPVLSSQFWLSTHVITIVLGYAGVFLAGVIGHFWLVSRVVIGRRRGSAGLSREDKRFFKDAYQIMMAILAFGFIFSFLGTMLGGVWADQSWGRFWGWDPKENGALLIVIWCAIMYHARLGNMVRETGMAALAVGGCVVVMVAWLGLNLLGVGLHSYGFTSGLFQGFVIYLVSEALFLLVFTPLAATAVGSRNKAAGFESKPEKVRKAAAASA